MGPEIRGIRQIRSDSFRRSRRKLCRRNGPTSAEAVGMKHFWRRYLSLTMIS